MIDHQPHATAVLFELAIALAALSWRTISSIDHFAKDSARQETASVARQMQSNGGEFLYFNKRTVLWWAAVVLFLLSFIGLLLFGTGWFNLPDYLLFWAAAVLFFGSALVAGWAEATKVRCHYSTSENMAAKPLEPFASGE